MTKEANRKLAAIMFADIVSYSRMMGANEKEALKIVSDFDSISIPIVEKFSGVLIKKNGDEIFCEFSSAKNAVDASVEMQNKLASYNDSRPKDFKLEVRIGIHIGDVVKKDNDIFGDGVNVAARIQPLAAPGGVCISGAVSDALSSHPDYNLVAKGKQELKHIVQQHSIFDLKTGHERKIKIPVSKIDSRNKFLTPINMLLYTLILTILIYFSYSYISNSNQKINNLQNDKKKMFIGKIIGDNTNFSPFSGGEEFDTKGFIYSMSEDNNVKSLLVNDNVELRILADSKKVQVYDEMLSGLNYNSKSYMLESHYDYADRCKSKGELELNYDESTAFNLAYYTVGNNPDYTFEDFLYNSYDESILEVIIEGDYYAAIMPIIYEIYDNNNSTGNYVVSIVTLSFKGAEPNGVDEFEASDGSQYSFALAGHTFISNYSSISEDLSFNVTDAVSNKVMADDRNQHIRVSAINGDEIILKFTNLYQGIIKERMILNAERYIIITESTNRDSVLNIRYNDLLEYKDGIDKDIESNFHSSFYDNENPIWSNAELNSIKTNSYFPYESGSLSILLHTRVKIKEVYDSTATAKIYSKENPHINIKVGDFLEF